MSENVLTIGTEYARSAPITAENGDLITYGQIFVVGVAMNVTITPDNKEPKKVYADNRVIAVIPQSNTTGSLAIDVAGLSKNALAKLGGHTLTEDGTLKFSGNDMAPALGLGMVGLAWDGDESKKIFEARFFPKVTFLNSAVEFATIAEEIDHKPVHLDAQYVISSGSSALLGDCKDFPAEDQTEDAAKRALAKAQNWVNGRLGQLVQVQFNLNGAQADDVGGQPADQNFLAGQVVPAGNLPQLNRQGFRFLGWALSAQGVAIAERFMPGIDASGALINGAQILYAIWQQVGGTCKPTGNIYNGGEGENLDAPPPAGM